MGLRELFSEERFIYNLFTLINETNQYYILRFHFLFPSHEETRQTYIDCYWLVLFATMVTLVIQAVTNLSLRKLRAY